ncbi:hypothetical protein Ga0074812_107130 [Parafrankia irregularis]|uniref:Uncharacterized protein n=1 Tax=Parafrankia irregularis TaxID=795642 RepID=A0A0S4QP16_9ACTN|nr:hypothetical protein Ga0074812_107130 [Parafrankia irregularis]
MSAFTAHRSSLAEAATSPAGSNARSVDPAGPNGTAHMVTMIVGTLVGFTFPLGLGNVAALGIRRCRKDPCVRGDNAHR